MNLTNWLNENGPGSVVCYHIGHLTYDRLHNEKLSWIANDVYRASAAGLVHLVQIRKQHMVMAYRGKRKGSRMMEAPVWAYVAIRAGS
jgi:hypothetical protein